MAINAGQITRDINLVVEVLDRITSSSKQSAEALKLLTDALARLTGAPIEQFQNLAGTMEEFVAVLKNAGEETGELENKLNNAVRAVERLQTTGRLQFGQIAGGKTVDESDLFRRLKRAASAAGATKEEIEKINLELDALDKRGTAQGGIIRLLNKLQREGTATGEVFTKMTRSARYWLAEMKRIATAQETTKGLDKGFEGKDSTFPAGGGQEKSVGKLLSEQRELYESILPGGKRAIDAVETSLKKMGLSLDDVGDITEDNARDIVRWTASMEHGIGITRRAVITTDSYGNILKSTSKNLRTFGAGIVANISKVAQWTAAIAIVYAPMRLLNTLTEQAVEIESKLADVQISLVSGQESLDKVWKESTTIAKELGVGIEGVIDGYVLAVRATANIINPAEKAAATVAVLKDSMILAKLAGIDQAIAMDTLVGALRQLNLPLTAGAELVDKWVAVSKAANVSLHTLAESFAITATAAENVGLTMDELNGFIAAVAEVTTLSATESGNAVRAFISGFQTDQAERELAKFGIAVKDVNEELRSFTDVIEDVISRKEIGLISDKELAKISEIIGGGARRGAQVNAFLENYGRVQELAAVSATASGDAAEAMAIKINILKSAIENLNTAFSELARAFGTDAGFIELVRKGVDSMTWFVGILTKLVQQLGKATPAIIAFAAAWQYLRKSARAEKFLAQEIDDFLLGGFDPDRLFKKLRQRLARGARSSGLGQKTVGGGITGLGGVGRGAVGGGVIGLGTALAAGHTDAKRIGTTMGGAAIGQMLAQGKPIGGLIGAGIVTAIWSNLIDREADLTEAWTRIFTGAYDKTAETAGKPSEERDFFEEAKTLLGGGGDIPLAKDYGGLITGIGAAGLEKTLRPSQEAIENSTLAIMDAVIAVAEGRATPDQTIISLMVGNIDTIRRIYPKVKALVAEIQKVAADELAAAQPGREGTAFALRLLGISDDLGSQATAILNAARQELLQDVASGQAGVRELTELLKIGDFEQKVSVLATSLTSLGAVGLEYKFIAQTVSDASEQEAIIFGRVATEIGALENKYRELEAAHAGYKDMAVRIELRETGEEIKSLQGILTEYLTVASAGQEYKAFQPPTLVGVSPEASRRQVQQAVRDAKRMTAESLDSMELTAPQRQKIIDSYGELAVQNVETYKIIMQGITEVNQQVLDDILDTMGIAAAQAEQVMGFQQVDLTAAQLPQLYGNIKYYEQLLEPTGLLDTQDLEDIVLLTSDHVVDAVTTYGILMNLAMQDLINISEQQLEGIFNIPEGVTAQIPFTGKLYFSDQPIPTAGGSGIKKLGDAVDSLTGETGKGLVLDQQQIDALQALLIISGGSETFLSNIEGLLREAGVEPEERGPVQEPVQWGDIRDDIAAPDITTTVTEAIAEAMRAQAELFAENPELKSHRRFLEDRTREETTNPELRLHQRFLEDREPIEEGELPTLFTDAFQGMGDSISTAIQQPFQQLFDLFSGMFDLGEGTTGIGGGITSEQVLSALPQSIPVNIQTRIVNPVTVLVDGYQIATAMYERQYEDLQSATRRQGAVGYIMEA